MVLNVSEEKVKEGLDAIRRKGGKVSGGTGSGSVSISGVKARYAFNGGKLQVVIDDTPFLVSESYVEGKIEEFFS